jgi:hypothetical protein
MMSRNTVLDMLTAGLFLSALLSQDQCLFILALVATVVVLGYSLVSGR